MGSGKLYWTFILLMYKGLLYVGGTFLDETTLRNTLENGYKQSARPGTPITINVEYSLHTLQSLDITTQEMTTSGWIMAYWHDPRLVWNSSDYSNITELYIEWAWRPEFYIFNSAGDFVFSGFENALTRFCVFNTGMVRWMEPLHVTTSCDVSIERFPFDSQSCVIEMCFRQVNDVDVVMNATKEINTSTYLENAEWQYNGGQAKKILIKTCCPLSHITLLNLNLSFSRLRPFYVINLLVPSILMSVCMVWTFLLPTECGERLGYSITILLSYTVLMTITKEMMPTTSKETPSIDMYLLVLLILCSICVMNVVVSVKMFYLESKPPKFLQKIAAKLKPIIFWNCCKSKEKVTPLEIDVDFEETDNYKTALEKVPNIFAGDGKRPVEESDSVTWQLLSELMDRICFYLYAAMCILFMIVFVCSLNGLL